MEGHADQRKKAHIAAERVDVADHILKAEDAPHKGQGAQQGQKPPGQPAAAGLYWGLARLRAAAAYGTSAPGRTVVRVPAPTSEETPGLRPAELDRLFQRDARRYDGRFTLF